MAFIAGIIDGDGSLSLIKKIEHDERAPLYYPCIQFSKSNRCLPDLLKKLFGGYRIDIKRANKKIECKWKLEKSANCLPFLEVIEPYIQIKSEQTKLLLKFIKENPFKRGISLTKEQVLYRDNIYSEIINLNTSKDMLSAIRQNYRMPKNKSSFFDEYVSGLFDTDGSFSIKKEITKSGFRYSPFISLSLISAKVFKFIRRNSRLGRISIYKSNTTLQGFCYRFSVTKRNQAIKFLKLIIPYLHNKKEQAKELLKFCELFESQNGRYKKTEEQFIMREMCYENIKHLNEYGVVKFPLIDLKPLPGNAEGNKAEPLFGTVNVASEETPMVGDAVL